MIYFLIVAYLLQILYILYYISFLYYLFFLLPKTIIIQKHKPYDLIWYLIFFTLSGSFYFYGNVSLYIYYFFNYINSIIIV